MLIASFDIGEKNFAYCIGEIKDGQINILSIAHHNVMIKKTQTVIESCIFITNIMKSDELLMKCDEFIIEQQMRCNTRAQRLAQHVWSTLYSIFPDRFIKFVPSHLKTQYFLGKNKLKDKERKTWSIVKVTQENVMNVNENHEKIIDNINQLKKKDDVCDTILQLFAYVKRNKNE